MQTYLLGSDNSILILLILLNVVLTVAMGYVFYRILTSKKQAESDYPLP
ncbi:MAG: hypothetical protein MUC59_08170 [Saprospiraceae bacterium]|jgi:flagellar basal body-associated protein FliL|nr:hypothetical protein [Saprospiraceae bacterium]